MRNELKGKMSNWLKKILSLVLLSFFLVNPILAQELTSVEPVVEVSNYELEGIEIKEITEVPSVFNLWWRGIRENVSLALTFDSVKKAEKSIQYAEERMKIAEVIANGFDQNMEVSQTEFLKNQERVQKNVEKAQKLMEKVEIKKEDWLNNKNSEKVNILIKNIASHQIRKEVVFDKLEEKLSLNENNQKVMEEGLEKIIDLRDKGLNSSQRLINAIDNVNIPEKIKIHLEDVKERIELHATEIDNYKEIKKQLYLKLKEDNKDIKEDLNFLNSQRKKQIKIHLESAKNLIPSMNRIMNIDDIKSSIIGEKKNAVQNRINEIGGDVPVNKNIKKILPVAEQERNLIQNRINDASQNIIEAQKKRLQEMEREPGLLPSKINEDDNKIEIR